MTGKKSVLLIAAAFGAWPNFVGWRAELRESSVTQRQADMVDTIWVTKAKREKDSKDEKADSTPRDKAEGELWASKQSAKRLSKRIQQRIKLDGRVVVRAVGSLTVNEALKAVAAADAMLQADDLKSEQVLAAVPSFQQIRKGEDATTVLFLTCTLLPRPRLGSYTGEPLISTGSGAKVNQLAAGIKNRLKPSTVVLAAGHQRIYIAVKAAIQAGRFLREDKGATGDELKVPAVAIVPRMEEFAPRFSEKGELDRARVGMRQEA